MIDIRKIDAISPIQYIYWMSDDAHERQPKTISFQIFLSSGQILEITETTEGVATDEIFQVRNDFNEMYDNLVKRYSAILKKNGVSLEFRKK